MESRRPRSMIVARAHGWRGPSEHRQKKQLRSRAEALPRRAIAYIRESTEEQGEGLLARGQRQAIARYADEHALELLDEYLDFERGRAADTRPGFQRLVEDAMAEAKRQLLQLVFERVWLDDGRVVAVRPKHAFAPSFQERRHKSAAKARCKERERREPSPRTQPH